MAKLFVLLVAAVTVLTLVEAGKDRESKKCRKAKEDFQACLHDGYEKEEYEKEGCASGDERPSKPRNKECKKLAKKIEKLGCDFVCEPAEEPVPTEAPVPTEEPVPMELVATEAPVEHCNFILAPDAGIRVGSDGNLALTWFNGRPDASGEITWDDATGVGTGYMEFPDDRRYSLVYYPDESIFYWDGDRDTTDNTWGGSECIMGSPPFDLDCVADGYDFWGADIRSLSVVGFEQCRQECAAEGGCQSFTYVSNEKVCWLKNRRNGQNGPSLHNNCASMNMECEPAVGACGYIQHTGGKCIHPYGGSPTPEPGTAIVTYDGCHEERLYYCLTENGELRHKTSDLCLVPGNPNPGNNEQIVFGDCGTRQTDFLLSGSILDVTSGKCWHPNGGSATPDNNNVVVVYDGCNEDRLRFNWQHE